MRQPVHRPTAALLLLLLTAGPLTSCTDAPPHRPAPDDVIKAATQHLTDACLARRGLTPPRPGQSPPPKASHKVTEALFGAGEAELSVRLTTGYVVRAHTDGCLASAQRRLYGDQRRWFRTSVIVNNLGPEAAHSHRTLAEVRAGRRSELAEWRRLRAHALTEATTVIDIDDVPVATVAVDNPPPKGNAPQ
ncbi:hypothetical protein SGFS_066600 [Streptomyces graminofaciens]|uniref:Lipoprotein n=1 Tax=Streptomyces graminofaciens TaxID=68212 RepID=A0ABM7FFN2_9ACTN|nr:hypothetical protein [Streptomyces graminofaciens]BBC35366.1 hypothetical protein SGFS_066600 [Streptomyces graminofaciens]